MSDKYAVFGNPIAHSLSPLIHTFFANTLNEDIEYGRVLVEDGGFVKAAEAFKASGGKGFNVTAPCKIDAFNFVDKLSDAAKTAGAVNTVKFTSDGVLGDNTDGVGFISDLKRLQVKLKGADVLLIGAGGAAQGILYPLVKSEAAKITVVNRTASKALSLAQKVNSDKVEAKGFDSLCGDFSIIINASSSSLFKELPPLDDSFIKKAEFVYDLAYTKEGSTVFTQKAQSLGVSSAFDGLGMLIMQAAASYEIWRGVRPDVEATITYMRSVLSSR